MQTDSPSGTATFAAHLRALHQLVDEEPRILHDPVAVPLAAAALGRPVQSDEQLQTPVMRASRSLFVMRTRLVEDELKQAFDAGVRQYVLLGAGLDTFAYRQPPFAQELLIYEVDHPSTQRWKQHLLSETATSVPGNLRFAPIDFESTSLGDALARVGFDRTVPSFFSWLGVVQYLTWSTIEATLRFVATQAPRSRIAFTFVWPDEELDGVHLEVARLGATFAAARGEPWLTRCRARDLHGKLIGLGFSSVFHLTADEAHHRYFANRRDGLLAPRCEELIVAGR